MDPGALMWKEHVRDHKGVKLVPPKKSLQKTAQEKAAALKEFSKLLINAREAGRLINTCFLV